MAVPGTSEHATGLAVDIIASEYEGLDDGTFRILGALRLSCVPSVWETAAEEIMKRIGRGITSSIKSIQKNQVAGK